MEAGAREAAKRSNTERRGKDAGTETRKGGRSSETPAGRPDSDKETVPVKPFLAATEMREVCVVPCTTERDAGSAEREKSGFTGEVMSREAVAVIPE
jgi:hypothetical protein